MMRWSDVLEDPSLSDLPYKIELNEWGQIVMSPATKWHARLRALIAARLEGLGLVGETFTECPVETRRGVRVPDVAWASRALLEAQPGDVFTTAPELCVEVVSPSNKPEQVKEKIALYLEAGALEVWTCDRDGTLRFFAADGPLHHSRLAPAFPSTLS